MKRFGFSLDEDLHAALQARANEEGCSMAALCREALFLHLQKPALELPLPVRPDTQGPRWTRLKRQIRDFLDESDHRETLSELDDFLTEPFRPEHTPDLLFQRQRPFKSSTYEPRDAKTRKAERLETPSCSRGRYHRGGYDDRYLDELWA